jgi:hypothetical protein
MDPIISEDVALMAERPERGTIFQDPEKQAEFKVELRARQQEVSAMKIFC